MMALPVAALMLLAGGEITEKWDEYSEGLLTERRFELQGRLAELIHELQLERGLSAGFTSSRRAAFGGALVEQRLATDRALAALRKDMEGSAEAITGLGQRRWRALVKLCDLPKVRASVEASAPNGDTWRTYSAITASALRVMAALGMSVADESLGQLGRAHLALRWMIEHAGQERAAINHVFASKRGHALVFDAAGGYFASQQAAAADFESLATRAHRALLRDTYRAAVVQEVDHWRRRASATAVKRHLLGRILAVAGYGGAIHHFKNFVLRGERRHAAAFERAFERSAELIGSYREIDELTAEEVTALDTLARTLQSYRAAIQVVSRLRAEGADAETIDRALRVDDQPAIAAIHTLEEDLASYTPEKWFSIATQRMALLEAAASRVLGDLLARTAALPRRAVVAEAGYALLILAVLFVSLFLVRRYELLEIASRARSDAAAQELELRVDQRTSELVAANATLQENIVQRDHARARLEKARDNLSDANQRLKDQQAQLIQAEKLSSIGLLASGVAHEVNNPLLGIKSCLQSLRRGNMPEARQAVYWRSVEEALDRIEGIVRSLTDYARPRAHERTVIPLSDTADGCLRLAAPALLKKRIQVNNLVGEEAPFVLVDPNQLMQALLNILLNAVHASPPGAEITIRAETREGQHGLSVQDCGPGIPEDVRSRIFDPFFSTMPEGEGTGLGLSISLGLIQGNQGDVEVDSGEKGTKFTVWLQAGEPGEDT